MRPPLNSLLLIAALSFAASTVLSQTQTAKVSVPFVGCKGDGQAGPLEAPKDTERLVSIPAEAAQKLAYYQTEYGFGVLAPRGWYCFGTDGSNGGSLYVSPQPIKAEQLFSDKWQGFTGPAIQISGFEGGTSGRYEVARAIARVFPAHIKFVRKVMADFDEPATYYPRGPYPKDKLRYKNRETVFYQTPPNTKGLGTDSKLKANGSPIDGIAVLVSDEPSFKEPSLIFLAARLPPAQANLTQAIIQQVGQEAREAK
jgi:hypothetical protein